VKEIELTKGQIALVDDADYEVLSQFNWHVDWSSFTNSFYARRYLSNKRIYMHREILAAKPGQQVDHKNHNTLDNRRSNIRIVDATGNGKNRSTQINNRSGITGVRLLTANNKWIAYISENGVRKYLGSFNSFAAAVAARKKAEVALGYECECVG
jgi:hypothetical protein